MITSKKLGTFEKYNGDIDQFARTGSKSEHDIISDSEWSLIENFLQGIELINKGVASEEYIINFQYQLNSHLEDEKTLKKLKGLRKSLNKRIKSPIKIYLYSILAFLFFCIVCIPILSMGHSGGEQVPLKLLAYASNYLFYGFFIMSIATSGFYWKWFKKYWYINLIIITLAGLIIIPGLAGEIYDNRQPDLTIKYPRPVTKDVFLKDSLNAKLAIDCLIVLNNRLYGGPNISYGILDTIIYSPSGNEIFIIYADKFEQNDLGNDLGPAYFSANKRGKDNEWELESGLHNRTHWGGSYHNMKELKESVRKFYFNKYKFKQSDSLEESYFWRIKNDG